jgi:cell division protein FtsW (lipid II flippase)
VHGFSGRVCNLKSVLMTMKEKIRKTLASRMKKNWVFGFFGFFAFFALPGILEGEWGQAIWLVWLVWFLYFIPRKKTKIPVLILLAVMAIFILSWAPWIDDKAIYDKVLKQRGKMDGTIDNHTGELVCDYEVMWAPFGRWVASCEGGYFVTFFGKNLF